MKQLETQFRFLKLSVVVAFASFQYLAPKMPTAANLFISIAMGLVMSLVPGYAAVRLGKSSDEAGARTERPT
jgi:hypothetical protein